MTDLLKQIAGHLTVIMGSAQPHIEGEEVTGYTIKTGSLHKLIGLLAGAGHPVIVPVVRWTGAPCHGMGGAHRCGDHRCTKDYCAAFGVPASPAEPYAAWNKVRAEVRALAGAKSQLGVLAAVEEFAQAMVTSYARGVDTSDGGKQK